MPGLHQKKELTFSGMKVELKELLNEFDDVINDFLEECEVISDDISNKKNMLEETSCRIIKNQELPDSHRNEINKDAGLGKSVKEITEEYI